MRDYSEYVYNTYLPKLSKCIHSTLVDAMIKAIAVI